MREIEIKARLRNAELILKNASEKGIVFGDPLVQDDTTYETAIPKDKPEWNIFRIRRQGDKLILTMKYKASSRSRDNHERETTIGNAEEVADMLERVGYSFGVRIVKSRRTAKYNGIELCLDEVDGLGTFLEAEKLTGEDADVDKIQSELWELFISLGVNPEDRIFDGYDTLMHRSLAAVNSHHRVQAGVGQLDAPHPRQAQRLL